MKIMGLLFWVKINKYIIKKMSKLAVFDFDRTIIDKDSDQSAISLLRRKENVPDRNKTEWTTYMNYIFKRLHEVGTSREEILTAISDLAPTDGIPELIESLAKERWIILIITDSNSVFVQHWLHINRLEKYVTEILTNEAEFDRNECLTLKRYQNQNSCSTCPLNMCKAIALRGWIDRSKVDYEQIMYVGDGRNDFCAMMTLRENDLAFVRRGYPCHKKMEETKADIRPLVICQHHVWDNGFQIRDVIFARRNEMKL